MSDGEVEPNIPPLSAAVEDTVNEQLSDAAIFDASMVAPVPLVEVLRWQSLLMQMIHPRVRRDFLDGLLDVEASQDLLIDLDCVRSHIIPPWRGVSAVAAKTRLETSRNHIMSLFNGEPDIFYLQSESARMWTYSAWSKYLFQLAI